jgi:hypothetical protein
MMEDGFALRIKFKIGEKLRKIAVLNLKHKKNLNYLLDLK